MKVLSTSGRSSLSTFTGTNFSLSTAAIDSSSKLSSAIT
jgi:hypothetical protein